MTNKELIEFNKKRKIQQVAFVTRDLEKTLKHWVEDLKIGPWQVLTFSEKTVKNFKLNGKLITEPFKFIVALTDVGDIQFEIVQPVYGPTMYESFLNTKGEGLHHVKEKLSDVDLKKRLEEYKAKGIEIWQTGEFGIDVHYCLHTEPLVNFILELGNCPVIDVPSDICRIYPEEK